MWTTRPSTAGVRASAQHARRQSRTTPCGVIEPATLTVAGATRRGSGGCAPMAASYGSVEASELRGSTRTPASTGRFDRVVPRAATQIAQFGRWQGPANPHRLAVLIRARPRSVHSSTGAPTPPNPRSPHARPGLHQRPRGPPGPPTPPDPTTASRRHPAPGKPHERAYAGTSP